MKNYTSSNEAIFTPQKFKNFPSALNVYFEKQCPQIGGSLMREVLVNSIYSMVCQFFPETTHLKPGQMPWITVSKNEKSSYGKSMKNTNLVPVTIDIVGQNDSEDRIKGKRLKDIKKDAVARICQSVDKQNGCLAQAELAIMLKISTATVRKYINEWELEHEKVLPRRGTVHDMGPTLTHKKIIIKKLFIDKKTVQETSRETNHSFEAIYRYISAFKKTLLCYQKNFSIAEIAMATNHGKRLIKQYVDIIEEYKSKGCILDDIQKFDAKIAPQYDVKK